MRMAEVVIAGALQGVLIAQLAMLEGIATDPIQRIAVRQLGLAQGVELVSVGVQFELGSDDLVHSRQCSRSSHQEQAAYVCEDFGAIPLHAYRRGTPGRRY